MIKLIRGDLFTSSCNIIAHGVNCRGKMNSGVARQIRECFPQAYADYIYKYKNEGWRLADVQLVRVGDKPLYVANCCTQDRYGYDGKLYLSYDALRECISSLVRFADREKLSIAMPRVGCGLAGGEWTTVLNIINKCCMAYPDVAVEIYSLEESNND